MTMQVGIIVSRPPSTPLHTGQPKKAQGGGAGHDNGARAVTLGARLAVLAA
jgi:hypothetical protein